MRISGFRIGVPIVTCLLCAPGSAQVTQRVSVAGNGAQGNNPSFFPSISAEGRYIAFASMANNLVPGDTNNTTDVFVRDRRLGATERVSVGSGGVEGNDLSGITSIAISPDGRFVTFDSFASNLVPGSTNGIPDILVRDRLLGTTERVNVSSAGVGGNAQSYRPSISADGRYVSFESLADNLVPGDTNGARDVFVYDRQTGITERVSVDSNGAQGDATSGNASMSADGRFVTFWSLSTNLVPGDTNGVGDVFVRDLQSGVTERVSVDSVGGQGNDYSEDSTMSADGRYVAFKSAASNLVPGDTNGFVDEFVHDRITGATERVSVATGGAQGDQDSDFGGYEAPSLSADGRFVAFSSYATNLVPGDTNARADAFVRDRQNGTTERVSIGSSGTQGDDSCGYPVLSPDGRFVTFHGNANNLVPGDTNTTTDVFLRDRLGGPAFIRVCDPGAGGVLVCPCANPPAGPGRGCDNSAATGGASLSAIGGTFLSSDSLVFTTNGEQPTAFSVVMQGNALLANGVVYGQGVRCVGGATKRLFTKTAVAGSMTAPDFGAGDPTVSASSAANGDVIQPGQSRYYLVYYRDPNVLGGCPASSTFNATQTGRVDWSP